MAIIVGIVSAIVIVALAVGFFFASGARTRRTTLQAGGQPMPRPVLKDQDRRSVGID